MKKNKMMRIASVLLIAVLMTTCAISGTFAKYVTDAEGTDSARVAKWGVEITANGETFTTSETGTVNASATANTVLSAGAVSDISDVVAPGMSGEMVAMTLEGTPEVAVKVTYAAEIEFDGWLDESGALYLPIIVTIDGTAYSAAGTNCTTAEAFATYLENKIAEYSCEYAAGTNLSTVENDSLAISWEWAYYVDDDTDVKDTYLGDQAADGTPSTISFTVTTTVTQID